MIQLRRHCGAKLMTGMEEFFICSVYEASRQIAAVPKLGQKKGAGLATYPWQIPIRFALSGTQVPSFQEAR
jgi:hypothetical protein